MTTPGPVRRDATVAIIGAGAMGCGIAQVAAQAGHAIRLFDTRLGAAEKARAAIVEALKTLAAKGKLDAAAADAAASSIVAVHALGDCVSASLVVEAIVEDLAEKRSLLHELEKIVPPATILASNTSSLSITALAAGCRRPNRVIGMHFFNPVPAQKLVEIVEHPGTAEATTTACREWVDAIGKTPIVVADAPGFATSRLGVAVGLEAIRMVEEGVATAEDIDTGMQLGYRWPMGPLRLGDVVGLDVRLDIAEHLARELGPRFEPPALLRTMVERGDLGRKSGRGFYDWS
jgi:3-hydroxybutyryl-CoA dehydrogenase